MRVKALIRPILAVEGRERGRIAVPIGRVDDWLRGVVWLGELLSGGHAGTAYVSCGWS